MDVTSSEDLSRSFHSQLGPDRLANRTRTEWDQEIVESLTEMIPRRARVADIGCGYGRIAIPLARAGYEVEGLDLTPVMIEAARAAAESEALELNFSVGSMMDLPYARESFDVIICLWSAFNELLEENEQVQTLVELWRTLAPGGFALLEGPMYEEPSIDQIESGVRRGPEHRVAWLVAEGLSNAHYKHDERSLRRICAAAGLTLFSIFEREWGGRTRLFLRIEKPSVGA